VTHSVSSLLVLLVLNYHIMLKLFFCFCKSFFVVVVWTMANYSFKWNDGTSCRRTSFQWIQYSPLFSSDNNEHTAEKECCRGCDQGCRLAFFNIQKISNFAEEIPLIFVPIVCLTVSILLCFVKIGNFLSLDNPWWEFLWLF